MTASTQASQAALISGITVPDSKLADGVHPRYRIDSVVQPLQPRLLLCSACRPAP